MAGENEETKDGGENKGAAGGEGTAGKPEVKPEPKQAGGAPKAGEVTPAGKPEPRVLTGDEDELPEDGELFSISKSALTKRLSRHTKNQIKERFGTDNLDEIKAKLDKASEYEAAQEERRKKSLSREAALKEELDAAKLRAQEAEEKYQRTIDSQEIAEVDHTATSILSKYIDDDAMDLAVIKLKKHVMSLDDDELKKPEKVIEEWAKEFAEKSPKYARAKAGEEEKVVEVQLNTGTKATKQEPMKGDQTKTPRPGQANSMSKAEYNAWKRRQGLNT